MTTDREPTTEGTEVDTLEWLTQVGLARFEQEQKEAEAAMAEALARDVERQENILRAVRKALPEAVQSYLTREDNDFFLYIPDYAPIEINFNLTSSNKTATVQWINYAVQKWDVSYFEGEYLLYKVDQFRTGHLSEALAKAWKIGDTKTEAEQNAERMRQNDLRDRLERPITAETPSPTFPNFREMATALLDRSEGDYNGDVSNRMISRALVLAVLYLAEVTEQAGWSR